MPAEQLHNKTKCPRAARARRRRRRRLWQRRCRRTDGEGSGRQLRPRWERDGADDQKEIRHWTRSGYAPDDSHVALLWCCVPVELVRAGEDIPEEVNKLFGTVFKGPRSESHFGRANALPAPRPRDRVALERRSSAEASYSNVLTFCVSVGAFSGSQLRHMHSLCIC
eukprot:gene12769-biopygen6470